MTKDIAVIQKKIEFSSPVEILHFQKELSEYFIRHQLMTPRDASLAMIKALAIQGCSEIVAPYQFVSNEPTDHITVTNLAKMIGKSLEDRGFIDVKINGESMNHILSELGYQQRFTGDEGDKSIEPTEKGFPFAKKAYTAGTYKTHKEEVKDSVLTITDKEQTFDSWILHWRPCIMDEIEKILFTSDPYEVLLDWITPAINNALYKRILKAQFSNLTL